eukprot:8714386-Pyramimonas_sp.AAC.1
MSRRVGRRSGGSRFHRFSGSVRKFDIYYVWVNVTSFDHKFCRISKPLRSITRFLSKPLTVHCAWVGYCCPLCPYSRALIGATPLCSKQSRCQSW